MLSVISLGRSLTEPFLLLDLLLSFIRCVWQPHGLEHARLPCPSLSPGVCSNSCPLIRWYHRSISFSVIPFSCPQSFPASVFSNESSLWIRWPKYWSFSFSISPSNEYSGLISFRIDWFDLLARSMLNTIFIFHFFWVKAVSLQISFS